MNKDNFLTTVYSIDENGKKYFPYKGLKGNKKGLFSVNFTNDTNKFEGLTEEELVKAIKDGKFKDRGTIRMLPLDHTPATQRNARAPMYFHNIPVKNYG